MATVAGRYAPKIPTEDLVYQRNGAAEQLAKAMRTIFQLYYFDSRDSMKDLQPKVDWGPAYADDLAMRTLLMQDSNILDASGLLRWAQNQRKNGPNLDRQLIIDNIEEVREALQKSLPEINFVRGVKNMPPLETYLS